MLRCSSPAWLTYFFILHTIPDTFDGNMRMRRMVDRIGPEYRRGKEPQRWLVNYSNHGRGRESADVVRRQGSQRVKSILQINSVFLLCITRTFLCSILQWHTIFLNYISHPLKVYRIIIVPFRQGRAIFLPGELSRWDWDHSVSGNVWWHRLRMYKKRHGHSHPNQWCPAREI